MTALRDVPPDEAKMRADKSKQRRFDELRASPYFPAVVAANQAYLRAAVRDAESIECSGWALSCQPATTVGRLSAITMKGMEVFVLHQADEPPADEAVVAFVIVDRSVLERYWPSAESLDEAFPGLDVEDSDYRDGGPDQIRLWGWHDEIIAALDDERFAAAARSLAEPHLRTTTVYSRYHNYQLTDHVLGRA